MSLMFRKGYNSLIKDLTIHYNLNKNQKLMSLIHLIEMLN